VIITQSQFDHNNEPHELTRRLVCEFDVMSYMERREVLQSLPLSDLCHLAHLLATHRPATYVTPDLAWVYLRFIMEPLSWDIQTIEGRYVAFFAGQPFLNKPADNPNNLVALDTEMDQWFNAVYAKQLINVGMEVLYAA
jgi:hypothetical protein